MADLKSVFDTSKLTEHDLGCIEFVLNSPAYIDVFKPYLERMRDSLQMQMLDRSKERQEFLPDDFLAGGVVAIKGLLELFAKIVDETRMERVIASQQASPTALYDMNQRAGRHDPILGANEQPVSLEEEPLRPEDDY